jgi:hypothetical protein
MMDETGEGFLSIKRHAVIAGSRRRGTGYYYYLTILPRRNVGNFGGEKTECTSIANY